MFRCDTRSCCVRPAVAARRDPGPRPLFEEAALNPVLAKPNPFFGPSAPRPLQKRAASRPNSMGRLSNQAEQAVDRQLGDEGDDMSEFDGTIRLVYGAARRLLKETRP